MHVMESSDKSPELIIIAGPNGSGKTTITTQFLHHEWSVRNFIYQSRYYCAGEIWRLELNGVSSQSSTTL